MAREGTISVQNIYQYAGQIGAAKPGIYWYRGMVECSPIQYVAKKLLIYEVKLLSSILWYLSGADSD